MDHAKAPKAAAGGNSGNGGGGRWDDWPMSPDEEFVPRRVFQKQLGICRSKFFDMLKAGELPPMVKIGSSTMFRKTQITAYKNDVIEAMRNRPEGPRGPGVPRQPKNKK